MSTPHLNVEHYRTLPAVTDAIHVLLRDGVQFSYCFRDNQHVISYPNPHAVRIPRRKETT